MAKTFAYSHKTAKFTKVFSFESFLLYGILFFYSHELHLLRYNINILLQVPDLDAIVGAVGSGGFMAGVCVAAKVEEHSVDL